MYELFFLLKCCYSIELNSNIFSVYVHGAKQFCHPHSLTRNPETNIEFESVSYDLEQ